jgi:hypothetical protein
MQYCKSVTLRMRDRRNGTKSLFLDFWPGYRNPETMELIRRRSLGMYIYMPTPFLHNRKSIMKLFWQKLKLFGVRYS